jgi:hypothetical protein
VEGWTVSQARFNFWLADGDSASNSPLSEEPPAGSWGVNFGGGVNSTALLLILHERGLRPDWVLFADTGSERPETYENVERVQAWSRDVGFPFATVRWLRKDGSFESVHANCLRTEYLPSKAYGYSGCTWKWKIQPMAKWRKQHGFEESVVSIGYDSGETRRVNKVKAACDDTERDESLRLLWYPLIAWGIDRQACITALREKDWPVVKSSCFVCPHMSWQEWSGLKVEHPQLFQTALRVEERAKEAGHADTVSIFKRAVGTCLCLADGCQVPEPVQ